VVSIVRRPPWSRRRLCVRLAGALFELSAQGPKLGGALKTSHPPPSTTSERSAMLALASMAHPSTELVARAPCQLRHSHARPVSGQGRARAPVRQQRRLEVLRRVSRKRDVHKTGGEAPSSRDAHAGTLHLFRPFTPYFIFFSRGRLP